MPRTRKPRIGRPFSADPRTVTKRLRMTPTEAKEQEAAARAEGKTWSAWAADAIGAALKKRG